ncbi:MAG: alpha-glucan family phosphorylase [Sporichthyaceae bacterium]|nr:alpha-glucan family phosphorylase [Sporichthyaceae bacterium]
MKAIRRFTVRTVLPAPLEALGELALNLRWSWHTPTKGLFQSLDPAVWAQVGGDPVALLGALGPDRLAALADDQDVVRRVADAERDLRTYLEGERWYQKASAESREGGLPAAIAYFSPEFGITAVLPQYSGGLGILAGDHLKAASDLGVPIVGVGLLYRSGYFAQSLSRDGWQEERYPVLDPNGLPISVLREASGEALKVQVGLPGGRHLVAQVWKAQVGRVPLLLLDSDVEDNELAEREVTDRLYGGGSEHRLLQEMLLGVGGVRALRAFSRLTGAPAPEVFHTNEGHAGFLGVERIRELTAEAGLSFDEAVEAARSATLFTTHTPVPAGIDRFSRDLVAQHFGGDNASPGVAVERVLALGAEDYEGGEPNVFNMAVMGFRLSQRANGVSELHGHVAREMFAKLWPGFDEPEVPIGYITNGVHAPTWVAPEVFDLGEREAGGQSTDDSTDVSRWEAIHRLSDGDLWAVRGVLRARLVEDARRRVRRSWVQRGASGAELRWVDQVLDPEVLTVGFARRVPSYKRLTLMLRDPQRLTALLLHPERPIQLVIAGKAHPADDGGKKLIQELVRFADRHDVRHRILFLPNYDIEMAQSLYPGCDVWLNNPLRPLEACGTSGMKAALNGCLNLSVLDGWWDEMYDGHNGWAIPTADGVTDPDRRDDLEARALYDLLENTVAQLFYDRDSDGHPARWIQMVRHTLQTLGPKVSATRMVRDYVLGLYAPAATASRALDGGYEGAKELAEWKAKIRAAWSSVRVDHVESSGVADAPEVGSTLELRAFVSLGDLEPEDVDVQVVHGRADEQDRITESSTVSLRHDEAYEGGRHRYLGEVKLDRSGPFGYTARVVPAHRLITGPGELGLAALPSDGAVMDSGVLR